ncbi:MAG: class I tRNA ligase family protein, partial [Clostridiales bacterium]
LRFQEERLEASRNFCNKIWNACRFALMNLTDYLPGEEPSQLTLADQWILEGLRRTALNVNVNLEKYELGEAARSLYDFTWDEFCDWYVELAKDRLYKGNAEEKYTAQYVLCHVLKQILQLLHPFIPFITEELWQHLPHEGHTIMLAKYPDGKDMTDFSQERAKMDLIMEIVGNIRNIRGEMNVPPGKKSVLILWADEALQPVLNEGRNYILSMAHGEEIIIENKGGEIPPQAASGHACGVDIFLPLKGLIDLEKEIARLEKEIATAKKEIARLAGKLGNEAFLAKAPADVVEKEKAKQNVYLEKCHALEERRAFFCG